MATLSFRTRVALQRNAIGLTTLEWLLIVAAVAGLAALAVVLVQNVVDDTAEEISGNNARITAAKVAAKAITDEHAQDKNDEKAKSACNRLNITYSDVLPETDQDAYWYNGKCEISLTVDAYLVDADTQTKCENNQKKYRDINLKWDSGSDTCTRA